MSYYWLSLVPLSLDEVTVRIFEVQLDKNIEMTCLLFTELFLSTYDVK